MEGVGCEKGREWMARKERSGKEGSGMVRQGGMEGVGCKEMQGGRVLQGREVGIGLQERESLGCKKGSEWGNEKRGLQGRELEIGLQGREFQIARKGANEVKKRGGVL